MPPNDPSTDEERRRALLDHIAWTLPETKAALRGFAADQPDVIAGLCLTVYALVVPNATEAQDLVLLREFRKFAAEEDSRRREALDALLVDLLEET